MKILIFISLIFSFCFSYAGRLDHYERTLTSKGRLHKKAKKKRKTLLRAFREERFSLTLNEAIYRESHPNIEALKRILEMGVGLNARDILGRTPLHKAVGSSQITKLLINHGANINARDIDGNTPLHEAIHNISLKKRNPPLMKSIKVLLKNGANPKLKDNEGQTPLDLARDYNLRDVVRLLE